MAKRRLTNKNVTEIAYDNIEADRQQAADFLQEIMQMLNGMVNMNPDAKRQFFVAIGPTITKLIEAQQRSNEQVVKIAAILKKASSEDEEFSDDDYQSVLEEVKKTGTY